MLSLNLPSFDTKIAIKEGKNVIFDPLRRKYVALTPEEWVRQHFINFLITYKGYPTALMANEVQVILNGTRKRCDSVLYRKDLSARMIIEYKAPDISINQMVFDQIVRYNIVLKVEIDNKCGVDCREMFHHDRLTFHLPTTPLIPHNR